MKILLVDDSRLARLELHRQLSQIENTEIVGEAKNIEEASGFLQQQKIDLVLLDIDLPDGTGFDLLEQLADVPQVIFVTAFNDYAIKSFEYNALDYLVKPVRQERLEAALAKVQLHSGEASLSSEQRIFLKDRDNCYFVALKDIFAFEAMGNYTRVHLKDNIPSIYKPIGSIEQRLDQTLFFRASRSWIINTEYIQEIEPITGGALIVTLKNRREVTISKRQAVAFKRNWSL